MANNPSFRRRRSSVVRPSAVRPCVPPSVRLSSARPSVRLRRCRFVIIRRRLSAVGPFVVYSQDAEERTYLALVRGFERSLLFKALKLDLGNEQIVN